MPSATKLMNARNGFKRPAKRICTATPSTSTSNAAHPSSSAAVCAHSECGRVAWGGKRRHHKSKRTLIVKTSSSVNGSSSSSSSGSIEGQDLYFLQNAARLADSSAGITQPHPNAAVILIGATGREVGRAFLRAQGTTAPEVQAVQQAQEAARGSTAYLNLESGDCHGDNTAIEALIKGGVSRVVVGLRHPLSHLRGAAVRQLQAAGVKVDVLGETAFAPEQEAEVAAAFDACLQVNAPLLHRAALKQPLSVLKYAMTLDGKIATHTGHSAWVSSPQSRAMVFEMRARSDAVVVGGNTVRRDNPRLTTRREGGHMPARVVMSRTLDLPEDANLWDVSTAPTLVMTQRGARHSFQQHLKKRGVEVVEFDFLTPEHVAAYCYERGYLQVFWECGGTLAAPAISSATIHKVMAFVAPKIIGGCRAPTPIGDLGFVEMTQAVNLVDVMWQQVGPDLLLTGYLPSSGGLASLEQMISNASHPLLRHVTSSNAPSTPTPTTPSRSFPTASPSSSKPLLFYKAWDEYGALSNFSAHPIVMPDPAATQANRANAHDSGSSLPSTSGSDANGTSSSSALSTSQSRLVMNDSSLSNGNGAHSSGSGSSSWTHDHGGTSSSNRLCSGFREWKSVEHYYQAQKYCVPDSPESMAILEAIAAAESPEEAARIGRRCAILQSHLVRQDWDAVKLDVMYTALEAKFRTHEGPRQMLLSTLRPANGQSMHSTTGAHLQLAESSPHDFFWGVGVDGRGSNHLGRLLMKLREQLAKEQNLSSEQAQPVALNPQLPEMLLSS